jgi:predicted AAA+ superfamily ATPase
VAYFDLEDPRDLARLQEPTLTLEPLRGLVVLDEVQRRPDLFAVLRVLADRPGPPARFLILGSASPELLRQGSETLAGRIAFYHLGGFDVSEVGPDNLRKLWFRGGFPESFMARTHKASDAWRRDFVRTFVERDIPSLGIGVPAGTLARFWTMLSHYHGQVWNASELGASLGVSHTTMRKYLDLLTQTFVIRQLQPWTENIGKRVVKSPKVFVADSGLLHTLLRLATPEDVEAHPKLGASWEGFGVSEVARALRVHHDECYFWRTHAGAELDLLVVHGRRRLGFEFKRTDAPRVSPSMRHALNDLRLNRLYVVHAGRDPFQLGNKIEAIPLSLVSQVLRPLR